MVDLSSSEHDRFIYLLPLSLVTSISVRVVNERCISSIGARSCQYTRVGENGFVTEDGFKKVHPVKLKFGHLRHF